MTVKVCVYSADGATKHIDVKSASVGATGVFSTAVSAVSLSPGAYYAVVGCGSACNLAIVAAPVEATSTVFGAGAPAGKTIWHGTVTHTSGTCNSTLGTITGTTGRMPGFRFDN